MELELVTQQPVAAMLQFASRGGPRRKVIFGVTLAYLHWRMSLALHAFHVSRNFVASWIAARDMNVFAEMCSQLTPFSPGILNISPRSRFKEGTAQSEPF